MGATELELALPVAFAVVRRAIGAAAPGAQRDEIATFLADVLYRDWYCDVGTKPRAHREDRDLCELLRAAHAGTGRWEAGWRVDNISSRGRVAVSRGPERRVVHVIDCIAAAGSGADLRPGGVASVVARRDSETINLGDWVTFSATWHENRDPVLRVYWNVMPDGAARLVEVLTTALDPDIPFFLKCPRRPSDYDRRDAVVLYLPRRRFGDAAAAIAEAAQALGSALEAPVPPLTHRIAPGVAVAEDPFDAHQSFGTSRCTLVAAGIAACICEGRYESDHWQGAVLAAFEAAGLCATRPWADAPGGPGYALP
jgi:hypothetical protein